jgi:arginyl-tRNA synthetase
LKPSVGDGAPWPPLEFRLAPNRNLGDFALAVFPLAKALGEPPPKVAQRVAGLLDGHPGLKKVVATGPYVNLTLDRAVFAADVCRQVVRGDAFGPDPALASAGKALLEHTSINPNASPHVGRARNALIGDSLARILRAAGYDLEVHYYVNDMGKQIAFLVIGCRGLERLDFEGMLDVYVQTNERAKTDPAVEQEAFALLKAFEEGEPAVVEEFRRVVQTCLDGQLAILGRLGITYDHFEWESSFLRDPFLDEVCARLSETGALFTDDDGRLVVDLQKLGFAREGGRYVVLRRGNNSSMYFLRDLAYNRFKADRAKALNEIVLGEDHKLYFDQLSLILKAAGVPAPEVVYYSYVLLKVKTEDETGGEQVSREKLSTRKGTVVLLSDFLDEATSRARQRVAEANPNLSGDDLDRLASVIGAGAVKFAMLRVAPNNNVTFDWDQALTFEGDSGPYVQYSCARIQSIFEKGGHDGSSAGPETWHDLEDAEWELVLSLTALPERVTAAAEKRNPAGLADFSLTVAKTFSRFYQACPVLKAEGPVRDARLALCRATLLVLEHSLGLLGIEVPPRM